MFTAYGIPLTPVSCFKYLGRILMASDDDWPAVVRNARRKWEGRTSVIGRKCVHACILGQIYFVVVQSVILYGSETWVMTPGTGRMLGGFHHRVACRLTGRQPQQGRGDLRTYPPLEDAMSEAGLQEVDTYVSLFQNTVSQFIVTRLIMNLHLVAQRRPGPRVSKRWW